MKELALLGDEAVALGALHAGVSASYGYPGTPSTEILEFLIAEHEKGGPLASWSTNEKTALEAALGVSFAGRRSLVTMKHVGLNVAADPFVNGSLLGIKGGLVLAVADDPGMHSSQDEQDTRYYASFAMVPCLEPRSQQEAYEMTKEAFELSERYQVPVIIRLTTRLSHARAGVSPGDSRPQNPLEKSTERGAWMLLPAYARKRYEMLIAKQENLAAWAESHPANRAETEGRDEKFLVITTGLGGNYYEENQADLAAARGGVLPARLHVGAYPAPVAIIRKLCQAAERVLVIEEGMPFLEEKLRGILEPRVAISGKFDGTLPRAGELDPDNVRKAMGLSPRESLAAELPKLPGRPPQLCQGCPHGDSYEIIKRATAGKDSVAVTSDIGCYALGALPPFAVPETIVCMGASVNMAKGASDAGIQYAIGVIGDSTFLHSGMTALLDAVAANTPMTLVILDNSIVAMTGCQETIVPSERLATLIQGLGVDPAHLVVLEALKKNFDANLAAFEAELEYRGLSVVIFRRECLEAIKARRKKEAAKARAAESCEG